jgi:hypothetical protein
MNASETKRSAAYAEALLSNAKRRMKNENHSQSLQRVNTGMEQRETRSEQDANRHLVAFANESKRGK